MDPLAIFVTGPPAAGKSTTAAIVAARTGLPLVSRDAVKASIVRTVGPAPGELRRGGPIAVRTFKAFEAVVRTYVDNGVSLVVEQACERGKSEEFIREIGSVARVLVLHCDVSATTSIERFAARVSSPTRRNSTDHEILAGLQDGSINHAAFGPLDLPDPIVVLDCEAPNGWDAVHDSAVDAVEAYLDGGR